MDKGKLSRYALDILLITVMLGAALFLRAEREEITQECRNAQYEILEKDCNACYDYQAWKDYKKQEEGIIINITNKEDETG